MSKQQTKLLHNIKLSRDQPTSLTFAQLHDWVIWQFPPQVKDGLSGAIHPPISDSSWYPAIIQPKQECIHVYGHLNIQFDSPEKASNWLLNQSISL